MKTKCPYCNYVATEHETIEGEVDPKEGDISFCISCGEANQFWKGGLIKLDLETLTKTTRKEIKDLETAWLLIRQRVKFENERKNTRTN